MKKIKVIFVYLLILFAEIMVSSGCNKKIAVAKQYYYTCPMHSDYIAYYPGNCPKCGMVLEQWEMKKSSGSSHSSHGNISGQSGGCH